MKKLLLSALSVGVVAVVAVYATQAYFSDTETSTGNSFVAGAIDLTVDNESYAPDFTVPDFQGPFTGALVKSDQTSWGLDDLGNPDRPHLFFNFVDLKPGDLGEDTISLHVNNNDAYLCAAAEVTGNSDMDCTEPEKADDANCVVEGDNGTNGDLAQQLNFAFWADDGDNVFEDNEISKVFLQGPVSGLNQAGQMALADSTHNVWTNQSGPVTGGQTYYIGKVWCFGDLQQTPVAADNSNQNGPLSDNGNNGQRGTGWTCNGQPVNNAAQTDKVMGDLEFYAVQSRNNAEFNCATGYTPFLVK